MNLKHGKKNKQIFLKEIKYSSGNFRVRLSKRRPGGAGSKAANLRLIQRYRPFLEAEEKIQVRLIKLFFYFKVFGFLFLEKTIESV